MIIAALPLDGLDNNGANVDVTLLDEVADFAFRLLFTRDYVRLTLGFGQREIEARTGDAGPVKFSKQIRLARIGIGQTHRVTGPPMKSALEMQNLRAAFATTCGHVLADFPIHRCLQTIL